MIFDDRDGDDLDDDFEKADGQHPLCKTNVGAAAGGAACTSCGRQELEGASLFFLCTSIGGVYANRRHIVPHTQIAKFVKLGEPSCNALFPEMIFIDM